MRKRSVVLIAVFCCFSSFSFSQDIVVESNVNTREKSHVKKSGIPFLKGWVLGVNYGFTKFSGDISQYDHYPAYQEKGDFHELNSAFSLTLKKRVNAIYSISAEVLNGKFSGLRRANEYAGFSVYDPYPGNYEGYGDKFTTTFNEVDLVLNADISNALSYFIKGRKIKNFSFEAKLGMGYNIYNSVRRNLFSDTYIYSFGYEDEGSNALAGSNYGSQKKDFFSSPSETVYLYGVHARYKLSYKLDLILDYTVRNGKTDKWDSSIMSTQNLSDNYNFLSLGISYRLGNHDFNNDWESPIDGLKEDVSNLYVEIDGFTDDSDNDGVSDAFDKNPNTPLGVAVDGGGNALDVDMDNVPDYRDADPFSNRGALVDANGVELDDDKDGVPNSKDLESNTPEGTIVNQFGMNISTANFDGGGLIYFPSVYFNLGSSVVESSNDNRIATIALLLKNNPEINLNVIGHTDNIGSIDFNKKLGLKRANAVINYLISNYNIDASRLTPVTKGETDPLSTVKTINNGLEERVELNNLAEINRRVDFEIAD